MPTDHIKRRVSHVFLCAALVIIAILVAARPLRVPGVYHAIGITMFAALSMAAWALGARAVRDSSLRSRQLALAGPLLMGPYALMSLLWVGLGPPWVATAEENQMRYLVLIVDAALISVGFVVLREALSESGERLHSTVGFAAIMLAGPMYLVWSTFMFGAYYARVHAGQVPQAIVSLDEVLSLLLFLAGALTYLATAAFAASLGRTQMLGRTATRIYITLNLVALAFLVIRGVKFPDPKALSEPWYTSPGFIAGIPAVPWIMPYFIGVLLLRRAGDKT